MSDSSPPLDLHSLRDSSSTSPPHSLLSSSDRYLSSDYYSLNRSIDSYEESFLALASSKFSPVESSHVHSALVSPPVESDQANESDQTHLLHASAVSDSSQPFILSESRNISAIFFLLFLLSIVLLFSSFMLII
jgi:hypothetical protein